MKKIKPVDRTIPRYVQKIAKEYGGIAYLIDMYNNEKRSLDRELILLDILDLVGDVLLTPKITKEEK